MKNEEELGLSEIFVKSFFEGTDGQNRGKNLYFTERKLILVNRYKEKFLMPQRIHQKKMDLFVAPDEFA
jgi:hypothetical protein